MDILMSILAFGAGILILYILCKILTVPLRIIWKLLVNAVIGIVVLFLFNLLGGLVGLSIPINAVNALITGFLGVPGVILILILRIIL